MGCQPLASSPVVVAITAPAPIPALEGAQVPATQDPAPQEQAAQDRAAQEQVAHATPETGTLVQSFKKADTKN